MRRRRLRVQAWLLENGRALRGVLAGIVIGVSLMIAVSAYVKVNDQATEAGERAARSIRVTRELARIQHANTQQNVTARFNGCQSNNDLRATLRKDARAQAATAPTIYKLLPQLNTKEVRQLTQDRLDDRLKAYEDYDCFTVALAAVPEAQRHLYHVP